MTIELLGDEFALNDQDQPVPFYQGKVTAYNVVVMPISPRKKSAGGIIIPDQVREAEMFMNCLGRIVRLGLGAYKIKRWEELGHTPDDIPRVGEIVRWENASGRKHFYKGVLVMTIRDEQIKELAIPEDAISDYRFHR